MITYHLENTITESYRKLTISFIWWSSNQYESLEKLHSQLAQPLVHHFSNWLQLPWVSQKIKWPNHSLLYPPQSCAWSFGTVWLLTKLKIFWRLNQNRNDESERPGFQWSPHKILGKFNSWPVAILGTKFFFFSKNPSDQKCESRWKFSVVVVFCLYYTGLKTPVSGRSLTISCKLTISCFI